jgi:LuxR family quorum-sensing transcriptional regulator LasR
MLRPLGPGKLTLEGMRFLPPILSPLIDAAKRGEPLETVVAAIVRMFGFDTFMYATSLSPRRGQEAVSYVFTTLPREWVARYDQQAYIEIDPRVVCTFDSALPFVWDQESERGKSAAVDAYLDDAVTHGVASGVSFVIYSPIGGHILVAFNSARPKIDELRRFEIARNLGDMLLLGIYFHEVFMKTVVERGLPPKFQGAPLTPQEKRCLALSAHGYTSRKIAATLKISGRTVELYFSQLRAKLDVSSRQEAVGKAIEERIIRHGRLNDLLAEISEQRARSSRLNERARQAMVFNLVG